MRPSRAALVIVTIGVLTFGAVFTLLQVSRSEAAPGLAVVAPRVVEVVVGRATSSLAARMAAGAIAIGVPIGGSEPLFRDVQPDDRLDVLVSVPSQQDGRPLSAVVVRGATVLRPPTSTDPLLVAVDAPDAIVLAHLVLRGTHLAYVIWPANGSPPPLQAIDERAARAVLGLAPIATAVQPIATLVPTPGPVATSTPPTAESTPVPTPRIGGFLYQAQPGDTWDSAAGTFNLSASELRQWNEAAPDTDLAAGTVLFVPRR